LLKEYY